ncbi:MAG: N-acetyltransferase [Calditrichota bacterium]
MSVNVLPLANTKHDRKKFIDMAWDIYRDYPHWVPPLKIDMQTLLDPEKHPFHDHAEARLFVAERDGKVVGRIAAHVNHAHNKYWEDTVGFFGFFECIKDQEVANALFEAARNYLREHGRTAIRGPFNWSTNEDCGLLIDTFDRDPVVMMTYNPPYYIDLIEKAGFQKEKDLYAYHIEHAHEIPDRLEKGVRLMQERYNFSLRILNMKKFWDEVEIVKDLYNKAWARNWGAVPMTNDEIHHTAKDLKLIVDPNLCYIVESEGEPVGFSLTLPDANQATKHANGRLLPFGLFKILWHKRKINFVRVILLGIVDQYRNRGVDVALYYETFKRGFELGYYSGEMSWILEDNYPMRNALEKFGAEIYKTYRIYQQPL